MLNLKFRDKVFLQRNVGRVREVLVRRLSRQWEPVWRSDRWTLLSLSSLALQMTECSEKRKHQMKVFCYSFFEFIAILLLFMCLASEWIKANFVVVIFYCHRYFRNHYMIIKISTMIARMWGDLQEPIVRGSDQVFGQKFWVLHFRAGIWNLAGATFIVLKC